MSTIQKMSMAHKKGTFVEFICEGKLTRGVVAKGGRNVTVYFGDGELQVSGPAHQFIEVDFFEQDGMEDWNVVSCKFGKNSQSNIVTFDAFVTYRGQRVIAVKNDGDGEYNSYTALKDEYIPLLEKLHQDSIAWCVKHSENHIEIMVEDVWIDYSICDKLEGISSQTFWDIFNEELEGVVGS